MLTQERLKELLKYNPETGIFTRLKSRGNTKAGDYCSTKDNKGYYQIKIDNRLYKSHQLAWLYIYGNLSENHIDHIDRNPSNNSIINLREASCVENQRNSGIRKNNTSGFKCVSWHKGISRWNVRTRNKGTEIFLGTFHLLMLPLAAKTYDDYAKANHGEFYSPSVIRAMKGTK